MKHPLLSALAVTAFTMCAANAHAGTYNVNTMFNGTVGPASTAPWLTATFTQAGSHHVTLTLTSSLETPSEFFSRVGFNVNPAILPSSLTIVQSPVTTSPTISSIVTGAQDAQNLQGGGAAGFGFDVMISFSTSNAGGGSQRFNGSDVVTFDISRSGLLASDFDYVNAGGANAHIGAHLQGIPGGYSAGVKDVDDNGIQSTVPEPSTIMLSAVGLAFVAGSCWRQRRAAA